MDNKNSRWLILFLGISIILVLAIPGFYIWHYFSNQKVNLSNNQVVPNQSSDSDYTNTIIAQWGQNNNEWDNKQFGFKLKFSNDWQGFKIIENAAVFDSAIGSYTVDMPDQSALLNISVYTLDDWNNPAKDDQGQIIYPDNMLIGKTDKYAISYRFYNSIDQPIKTKFSVLMPELIKTFISQDAINQLSALKTYENKSLGLSFKYPSNWIEKQPTTTQSSSGMLVFFDNPDAIGPNDFEVNHWDNINSYQAKGVEYSGQPQYKSLEDYFKDPQACKKEIKEIKVSNINGYLVEKCGEGTNLAVMIENNGIFEFSFNSNSTQALNMDETSLISSITLSK